MDTRQSADNNKAYYYHFDGLGSVVALSNSNGDSCQSYEYSAYGQMAASDSNHPNPYMFTGRRFDIETGLYYYRARYYNPHIGRFMQTDPVGYDDGINWYLYCRNNPLIMLDPSGCLPHLINLKLGDITSSSGAPTASQLVTYAIHSSGGTLSYTDSEACWDWAMAEENWAKEFMAEVGTIFLIDMWTYARNNHYDSNTGTFVNLDNWEYEHPLTGTYTTPEADERKISLGEDPETYSMLNSYYWIHNTQVELDYTLLFSEDGKSCTLTTDIKIIDEADLELEYRLDSSINSSVPTYEPYNIEIDLGTHTVGWSMVDGLILDGDQWFW